jgi:hypothetical protein
VTLARWSAAPLALALVLFISTLYAYDTLLMPTRFWTPRSGHLAAI